MAAKSLPEIAATPGHMNRECAAKKCAASVARLALCAMVLDDYRKSQDPAYQVPLPSGLGHLADPSNAGVRPRAA